EGAAKEGAAKEGAAKEGAAKDGAGSDESARPARRPGSAMEAKAVNDAVAYIRSLAQMRARNADWAESAVREGASLSAEEAKARNVVDLIATSVSNLLELAHGRTVTVGERSVVLETKGIAQLAIDPDWRTRMLSVLTNPNLALILMMIGFYGL